jgi:hypothetical protein
MTNDCFKLADVLKEEYSYIHDFYPEGASTWRFKRDHLLDSAKMALRLKEADKAAEPLTKRILEGLPPEAKEQLKQYELSDEVRQRIRHRSLQEPDRGGEWETDGDPPESLQNYIVEALNSLLNDPNLRDIEGRSPEWEELKAEAEARARMDMSTLPAHAGRTALDIREEITREVTHEVTRQIKRKTPDEIRLEITHETTRETACDTASNKTMSFNRRLLEMAYPHELREIQDTLAGVYDHIHAKQHAALCLSGGGVRSATFCLGIIQALAEKGLLDKFDYLSTVSGGGYIGGWLSAWSHRHPNGLCGVMNELEKGLNHESASSIEPEAGPVSNLRRFSNYLTPKLGLFSADSWTLVASYLRNLLLNWLVLTPLIAAAVILPRVYVGVIESLKAATSKTVSAGAFYLGLSLLLISVGYIGFNRPSTGYRRQRSFLLGSVFPMVLAAMCLAAAFYGQQSRQMGIWYFVLPGAGLKLFEWFMQFPARKRRPSEIAELPVPTGPERAWECIAAMGTGVLGGWLVWLAASHLSWASLAKEVLSRPEWDTLNQARLSACLAVPLLLLIFLVTESVFVGLVSRSTTDEDREWWARAGGWILLAAAGWAVGCALVLYSPGILSRSWSWFVTIGSLSGISTILIGKSAATPAKKGEASSKDQKARWWKGEWLQPLMAEWSLALLAPMFLIFLIALISKGVDLLALLPEWKASGKQLASDLTNLVPWVKNLHISWDERGYPWPVLLVLFCGFVIVSLVMAFFIDANKFSLNSGYKNRLIRAFLGPTRNYRNPNPFTGFDPEDNLAMYELGRRNRFGFDKKNLFHILNLTLNLVDSKNPAWQERKAASFTVSPLHCGNHDLGYRSSEEYASLRTKASRTASQGPKGDYQPTPESSTPITLGFAMSISGAVASPNMGYHSSWPVTFLMTLFNVRLGAWLSNPGKCGDESRNRTFSNSSYLLLLRELFGKTNETSPHVYLSDGGHFENLGLYEMVLRRCRHIVVIDAGHDPKCAFGDLGNAVRKIRTDLGVPIEFKGIKISPRNDDLKDQKPIYCALGTIGYSHVDREGKRDGRELDGKLLYIKPAFYGNEPRDVYEYAKRCAEFPHETTVDQWFGESQFESYRALGYHIFNSIFDGIYPGQKQCATIKALIDTLEEKLSEDRDEQAGRLELLGVFRSRKETTGKAG